MNDLPTFAPRPYDSVQQFIADALTNHASDQSHLLTLLAFADGHYRAVFGKTYFILPPETETPSKSQWNSLKKKLKRLDARVFIFKEHGEQDGAYYLDFGFFAK